MMTGNGVMHNGTTTFDEYGQNLDKLKVHFNNFYVSPSEYNIKSTKNILVP